MISIISVIVISMNMFDMIISMIIIVIVIVVIIIIISSSSSSSSNYISIYHALYVIHGLAVGHTHASADCGCTVDVPRRGTGYGMA